MGIENMRRWPIYVFFAISILLALQLFNSWGLESDLRYRIGELSSQLQDCTKQHTGCMEQFLTEQQLNERHQVILRDKEKMIAKLSDDNKQSRDKAAKAESQANRTLVDVELCKVELQSFKNLQQSKKELFESLQLDKETLTSQLEEQKLKIKDLEKENEKLKLALATKSAINIVSSKVTPPVASASPKISPVISNIPINEPILENNAKEEMEEMNMNDDNNNNINENNINENNINDNNENFDPQLQ
ncbi:rho GTPase-activating protein gacU-like [Hyposmocoma kahamanoa]|uniref:rho GTPase-activating protein gacU-like n=1 Tax=Hyposmocoma kahamanoa TaxID=1477025 RepID=UPI000E6D9615|nr:rho GTPase-activating protein gacU-like [Hyposmocoma kahamanoa]